MRLILVIIAGPLFIISSMGYVYVKIRLKPGEDLDDFYYELEHQHSGYARYSKYSRITFTGVIISMLLLFIAMVM